MESYAETFGSWQGNACSGVRLLAPVAATADTTRVSFAAAAAVVTDRAVVGLGQPVAMAAERTHKSITRPGSPPRGRLR